MRPTKSSPEAAATAADRDRHTNASDIARRIPGGTALAHRAAAAVLGGVLVALILGVMAGHGSRSPLGRLGGDYPAFYSGGRMVLHGEASKLYDAAADQEAQAKLFGSSSHRYLSYNYPPVVAELYAPLALLPYRLSFLVATVLMLAALAVALALLRPEVPWIRDHFTVALAGALTFYPMLAGVLGGQNTAVSLLCVVAALRARRRCRPYLAGLLIGVLLLKPQLACLFVVAYLVSRQWRVLAGIATSAAVVWAGSAAAMGPGWPGRFLHNALGVPGRDALVDRFHSIALPAVLGVRSGRPLLSVRDAVTVCLVLAVATYAVRRWLVLDRDHDTRLAAYGVVAAATLLVAPHAVFYDAGLALVAMAAALGDRARRDRAGPLVLWAAAWLAVPASHMPLDPLVLVVAAAMLVAGAAGTPAPVWPHWSATRRSGSVAESRIPEGDGHVELR